MPTNHPWIKRGKRLTEMDWDEICVRTRQAFAKRCDFAMYRLGIPTVNCNPSHGLGHGARFFFRKEELPQILSSLWKLMPEKAERIVEQAEQLCGHRFDLLGYERVDYGPEIDWHFDAVHNKRAPLRPWYRIPYLDFHEVGDSKVIWELNRHQHLVTLAKAYRLTEEECYSQEFFRQWYHWREQNPYPIGINWASSLEVAFRSLSWLWAWHLLDGCSVCQPQFSSDLQQALALNARHIDRFLSTYFSPNTHLLGEGVGLFFIGTLCPDLPSAGRWQECGWQIILREAQRQVRQDGLHFEQSMYYHTYALDFFLHSRILAGLNGVSIPPAFDQSIQKMLDVTSAFAGSGNVPQFGDDDGGRLFDPSRNRQRHLVDPLYIGAALYGRPDFRAAINRPTEELLWLLGIEGVQKFNQLPAGKQRNTSYALEPSGIYVMRSSNQVSYQLVIDAGPQGAGRCGHGHADALSVQLSGNGKPLLIDPGTLTYANPVGERNRFRGTAAHNTVQVDRSSQAEFAGPFEWRGRANATVDTWITGKTFDFFVGSHTGYLRPNSSVRHRRYIFQLKSRFWVIRDVLEGEASHQLEAAWHFAPGSLHAIPGGAMFVSDELAPLALLFTTNCSCRKEILQDWHSPVYGRREPSPTFKLSTHTALPAEFTTMLIPDSEVAAHLGVLRTIEPGHRGVSVKAFRYSTANAEDHWFFADESGGWQVGMWASDAKFLYCSTDSNHAVSQFVICSGSYFELNGRRLFDANLPVKQSEWSQDASERPVTQHFAPISGHQPGLKRTKQLDPPAA